MNKEIITKLYEKHKSSKNILNVEDMLKKHNSFFSGKWGHSLFKNTNSRKKIVFGLECGLIFFEDRVLILYEINFFENSSFNINYNDENFLLFFNFNGKKIRVFSTSKDIDLSNNEINIISDFLLFRSQYIKSEIKKKKIIEIREELVRDRKIKKSKEDFIKLVDKNKKGKLDFIEGGDDFNKLLKNHQSKILEIDRNYIQNFVKVSNYLKSKKENLQKIYSKLLKTNKGNELEQLMDVINLEIYSYNLILINSINLINSIVEDDMITFYEIYEKFDKLNMFNSNWENEVSKKLIDINTNIVNLLYELNTIGNDIVNSINDLSYITQETTSQISSKLEEIDSTLKIGNLINVIQTYQTYKINKNTKSLK